MYVYHDTYYIIPLYSKSSLLLRDLDDFKSQFIVIWDHDFTMTLPGWRSLHPTVSRQQCGGRDDSRNETTVVTMFAESIGVFPKIGVPQNGWFIMENWMIWWYHYLRKHPYRFPFLLWIFHDILFRWMHVLLTLHHLTQFAKLWEKQRGAKAEICRIWH